jgi:hypothetical protein
MADQSESILKEKKKKRDRGVIEMLFIHLFKVTEENYEIPQDILCSAEIRTEQEPWALLLLEPR